MTPRFDTICQLAGALLIAVAGIIQVIDETTMIVLIAVLTGASSGCDRIRPRRA